MPENILMYFGVIVFILIILEAGYGLFKKSARPKCILSILTTIFVGGVIALCNNFYIYFFSMPHHTLVDYRYLAISGVITVCLLLILYALVTIGSHMNFHCGFFTAWKHCLKSSKH